jgi:hypothetical protein
MSDRTKVGRLALRVERASLAQAQLRTILAAADEALAGYRRELRNAKARIARRSRDSGPIA